MSDTWAFQISGLTVSVDYSQEDLAVVCARATGLARSDVIAVEILKRSIDARKTRVQFVLTVVATLSAQPRAQTVRGVRVQPHQPQSRLEPPHTSHRPHYPVVVIGAGPGGLFAAWTLVRAGLEVIVLDRGKRVRERARDVRLFFRDGLLDPESNVLFGEGGAGTFSDGKLYTRNKKNKEQIREVWRTLVDFGAPPEILIDSQPHIGTDKLRRVIPAMVDAIVEAGGDVRFGTRVDTFVTHARSIHSLGLSDGTELRTDHVIVATGHSARDTYEALFAAGVEMEARPFAMGVRIEHPQSIIDNNQYGATAGHARLGAAAYKLTNAGSRACYSFCMCPGGVVVGSTQEPHTLVTNGMSAHGRSGQFANAGLVVPVQPEDYSGETPSPLDGVEFQRRWERLAYELGGGGFVAPAQRASDFLARRPSAVEMTTSYLPGVRPTNLWDCLPKFVGEAIAEGLRQFETTIPGFAGDTGVLMALESRVSSPLRIPRGEDGQSRSTQGLYPVGEGAGFAGGITSAAVDGIQAARRLLDGLDTRYIGKSSG